MCTTIEIHLFYNFKLKLQHLFFLYMTVDFYLAKLIF